MKLVYLLAFYVVNKFSYDDIFIEKFMNIRFCDKRFYVGCIYCYQNHDVKKGEIDGKEKAT